MKLDLLKSKWIDMVFEGRNKSYGAYELRKENPKTSFRSLLFGSLIFSGLLALPLINFSGSNSADDEKVTIVDMSKLAPPPPPDKPVVPPPPPPPPAPKIDEVKFVKPKIVEKEKVVEEIKTIEELKDKNVGIKDVKGNEDGKIVVTAPSGEGKPDEEVVDNSIYNTAAIQVQPEFPGGMKGFNMYCSKNYRLPQDVEELKGRVLVEFVVEKDGSLTDVKVLRDIGYGTGPEAIRMLKNAPRWKPGNNNGKAVRAKFVMPIAIDMRSE